jgi:hypothetical protein
VSIAALSSRRLTLIRDALEVVLHRLAVLPRSSEVERLQAMAEDYLREAHEWRTPTPAESENLSNRVLALHVVVAKIGRVAP